MFAPIRFSAELRRPPSRLCLALITPLFAIPPALAQQAESATIELPAVDVSGPVGLTAAPAVNQTASAFSVSGETLQKRIYSRPVEALEAVPGLIVDQHSGEGKANQYFLRGFYLDHGTDLAIWVDGMPINMRTHAHGQGYADLNFLIPELIQSIDIRKGPYFADEGDFSTAGAVHVNLIDSLDKPLAQATIGSFNYKRFLGIGATPLGEGNLLMAGDVTFYGGPWVNPDDLHKVSGVLRYSQGSYENGFSLTAMAYGANWNATNQIPERAITSGLVGLYGEIDPTDGGNSNRFSLSTHWASTNDASATKIDAYVIRSNLNLYNDFEFALPDPVRDQSACTSNMNQCDQFLQHDGRTITGLHAAHVFKNTVADIPFNTEIGAQLRYDDINVDLSNSFHRAFTSATSYDAVQETSVGLYVQNTAQWTNWLRTYVGGRLDVYDANVDALLDPSASGHVTPLLANPKFGIVLGPFYKTELYANAGGGFHSNDARGAVMAQSGDGSSAGLLVPQRGAEIGFRSKYIEGLNTSVAVFVLKSASETLFDGDLGQTAESSLPSLRYGVEWTNEYRPVSWLSIDADLAATHARLIGYDSDQEALYQSLAGFPSVQLGNAPGNYVPEAPSVVASAGFTLGEATGPFGGLRFRYIGPRPLTEDGAFWSPPMALLNGQIGYKFENGWRIQLDAYNLTNSRTDQITYAYGSLLTSDALYAKCYPTPTIAANVCQAGIMDKILHPVEPLAVRVTVAGQF